MAALCEGCRNGEPVEFRFSMAFQPIMDVVDAIPFAYEALVRGPEGQSAASVLEYVTPANRYAFDQQCRVKAIQTAAKAGLLDTPAKLSINFLPNAVYEPKACIQLTLKTASEIRFPTDRLIFEFTENEEMLDPAHVSRIVASYRQMGFGTAIDGFGAGHAGLNLLARFRPDIIKLDMALVRGLDADLPKRIIIEAVVRMCAQLGVTVIAEGIETRAELEALRTLGVRYMQGYLFARPAFERLPAVDLTDEIQALTASG